MPGMYSDDMTPLSAEASPGTAPSENFSSSEPTRAGSEPTLETYHCGLKPSVSDVSCASAVYDGVVNAEHDVGAPSPAARRSAAPTSVLPDV